MFEQAFKNIDDVLWKEAGCTTELDYTEQTSWLLFLKYLDGLEQDRADEAALDGKRYAYILEKQYRCESWAAPKGKDGKEKKSLAYVIAIMNMILHGIDSPNIIHTERLESIYQRKLAALDELKKSLLHQAFSGQL